LRRFAATLWQEEVFPMTTPGDRLTTLEIRAAEQEKTIEELSGQIVDQWKEIERLQKTLEALATRFLALEEQAAPDTPVTRPPHW
jgi:SlyX protein